MFTPSSAWFATRPVLSPRFIASLCLAFACSMASLTEATSTTGGAAVAAEFHKEGSEWDLAPPPMNREGPDSRVGAPN